MLKVDYRTNYRESGGFTLQVYVFERKMVRGGEGILRFTQLLQTKGIKRE